MGSFDSVNTSLREAFTALRMTGWWELAVPTTIIGLLLVFGWAGLRTLFIAADQAEFL